MLNSGSCDGLGRATEGLLSARAHDAAQRLPLSPEQNTDPEVLRGVARDFASLLYTTLVQQMQKTVREEAAEGEEEEEPMKESVEGFVSMFLPQALADGSQDPLSKYVYDRLRARYGESVDERA